MRLNLQKISLKKNRQWIVKDVTTHFESGKLSCIIGVNGSGKSMLLKSALGLEKGTGEARLDDEALLFRDLSYIPQGMEDLHLSVFEVVLLGLHHHLGFRVTDEQMTKVNELLCTLNLSHLTDRDFATLSGGQKQMVLLAQALIKEPKVIIADEPTSALDLANQLHYIEALKHYITDHQAVGIVVLHDLMLAARYADTIYVMQDGKLTQSGPSHDVLHQSHLEPVYGVELEVAKTPSGFISIIPLKPKEPIK